MDAYTKADETNAKLIAFVNAATGLFNRTYSSKQQARTITADELIGDSETNTLFTQGFPYAQFRTAALLYAHKDLGISKSELSQTFYGTPDDISKAIASAQRAVEQGGMRSMELINSAYLLICRAMGTQPAVTRNTATRIVDQGVNIKKSARTLTVQAFSEYARNIPKPAAPERPSLNANRVIEVILEQYNKLFEPKTPTDRQDLNSHSTEKDIAVPRDLAIYSLYHASPVKTDRERYALIKEHVGTDNVLAIDKAITRVLTNIIGRHEPTQRILAAVATAANLKDQSSSFLKGHKVDWKKVSKSAADRFSL